MNGWRERVWTALFPNRCCLCNCVLHTGQRMCRDCVENAPFVLPPVCEYCGLGKKRCSCEHHRRTYERVVMPFYYEKQAHDGIQFLKTNGYVPNVRGLAAEMAELVRREYGGIGFHMVTAVPLYEKDWRRRGFNSAELLAKELASLLDVPYQFTLKKIFPTQPQKELTALERSGNLLGAFDVMDAPAVVGRTVLLVDDVITTGSTLDECAKMLKLSGASAVYAVTAAASVLKKDEN